MSAGEADRPAWPGQPMTAHRGVPNPAAVERPEAVKMRAFRDVFYARQPRC